MIEFKNKPNLSTPISAANLNKLQNDLIKMINGKLDVGIYDKYVNDANTGFSVTPGIYRIRSGAINFPFNTQTYFDGVLEGILFVLGYTNGNACQIAYDTVTDTFWYRYGKISSSTFSEYASACGQEYLKLYEWRRLIPEVKIEIKDGEEHETNTILNGKKVYVKRIDCGPAPNASTKEVPMGINTKGGICKIVKYEGVAYYNKPTVPEGTDRVKNLPYIDKGDNSIYVDINGGNNSITITTNNDRAAYHCYVDVYYVYN